MKNQKLAIAAVIVLALAYFVGLLIYSHRRPIDGDEGFYTTAARLVAEGKTPYQDFIFPQAPLLPYVYAMVWLGGGHTLESMRALSAACGAAAVLVWGLFLVSAMRLPPKIAFATLACLLLNPYWISWNVVVKTYAVSNLLISLALVGLFVALTRDRPIWFFASGLTLGLTTSVRSLYGPLVPLVLAWMLLRLWRSGKGHYSQIALLAAGALIGLMPITYSFLRDPQLFLFNNIQFHLLWRASPPPLERIQTCALFLLSLLVSHPFLMVQIILAMIGVETLLMLGPKEGPIRELPAQPYFQIVVLLLVTFTATSLTLFPLYKHYFTGMLIPFLVPFVAKGISKVLAAEKKWQALLLAIVPLFSLAEVSRESWHRTGGPDFEVSSFRQVVRIVEANSSHDDIVLSFWPGYVFESKTRYFSGMENHFGFRVSGLLTAEERSRYHIPSKQQVIEALSTRVMAVVVVGAWMDDFFQILSKSEREAFEDALRSNYVLAGRVQSVKIYRRRD